MGGEKKKKTRRLKKKKGRNYLGLPFGGNMFWGGVGAKNFHLGTAWFFIRGGPPKKFLFFPRCFFFLFFFSNFPFGLLGGKVSNPLVFSEALQLFFKL